MACPHQALGRPCYLLKVWPPQAESNQMELNQETIVKSSKQVNVTIEEPRPGWTATSAGVESGRKIIEEEIFK